MKNQNCAIEQDTVEQQLIIILQEYPLRNIEILTMD